MNIYSKKIVITYLKKKKLPWRLKGGTKQHVKQLDAEKDPNRPRAQKRKSRDREDTWQQPVLREKGV